MAKTYNSIGYAFNMLEDYVKAIGNDQKSVEIKNWNKNWNSIIFNELKIYSMIYNTII